MSEKYQASGIISTIGEVEQVSEKFRKRLLVIEDNTGKWPELFAFELKQDKCELADQHNVGDAVTVHFNISGREWKKPGTDEIKYFTSLHPWRIESALSAPSESTPCGEPAPDADIPF